MPLNNEGEDVPLFSSAARSDTLEAALPLQPSTTTSNGNHTSNTNNTFDSESFYQSNNHLSPLQSGDAQELLMQYDQQQYSARGAISRLFARRNNLEAAGKNHKYSSAERAKLAMSDSIDYLAPSSKVYRQWLSAQPWGRHWDRWLMMAVIGITTGAVAFLLHFLIHALWTVKYHGTRWLLAHTNVFVGWLFNVSYSLILVYASTWLVVNRAPEAAGAGVAEVTAYLNGCFIPKILNIKTFYVKFLSAVAAVGSGLPVGPEGPMIHIGAIIASGLSQGHSTTLGFDTGLFRRFQNPKDKREFVTAGAATGVAAAFSAPVGGLLFVFEEVASFWQQALGWQIFFACMISVLTLDTLRSAAYALREGTFGLFDKEASTVFFEVQTQLTNHIMATVPAAVCGIICGLAAIAFTLINLRVVSFRAEILRTKKQKMMEPLILIVLFVTLGMIMPLFFPCTPTQCVIIQGETTPVCPQGISPDPRIQRIVEESLELYTCSPTAHTSEIPAAWDPEGSGTTGNITGGNITFPQSYNELATLMSVTGEDAIRHLLSRATHREFGYAAIICMLIFYFLGAAWTAGSAISSGVFVPMLLIGACIGRLIGIIMVDIAAKYGAGSPGAPPGVFLSPSPWAWIDPGAFALIGAGAFMGGVTRMTLSLAVIIMEMSNDVRILLPAMVAIMLAKWVADAGSHSLYHGLLEVKCVPFLPREPSSGVSLDLLDVGYVMRAPVVTLRERMTLGDLRDVLRKTRHNGFPVVRDVSPYGVVLNTTTTTTGMGGVGGGGGGGAPPGKVVLRPSSGVMNNHNNSGENGGGRLPLEKIHTTTSGMDMGNNNNNNNDTAVFIGLLTRDHLLKLLLEAVRRGTCQHLEVPYSELNHQIVDNTEYAAETEQQLAVLEGRPLSPDHYPNDPALWEEEIDLTPYINFSAVKVAKNFSVERAYIMFSTMGLRHLVVVDDRNRVRGIITRKDLLGFRLDEAVERAKAGIVEEAANLWAAQQHDPQRRF